MQRCRILGRFFPVLQSHHSLYVIYTLSCILIPLHFVKGEAESKFPIINRCCPLGSQYDVAEDICVNVKLHHDGHILLNSSRTNQSDATNSTNLLYGKSAIDNDQIILSSSSVIPIPADQNATEYHFRVVESLPSGTCAHGNFILQLRISADEKRNETVEPEIENGTLAMLTSRGELKFGKEYYAPPEYCLFGSEGGEIASVRVCNATCAGIVPCIRKCCDLNEVWDMSHGGRQHCTASDIIWSPEFYKTGKVKTLNVSNIHPHYKIVHPRDWCDRFTYKPRTIEQYDSFRKRYWKFRLGEDGNVFRRLSRYTWQKGEEFTVFSCIDGGINSRYVPLDHNDSVYSGLPGDNILFECGPVPQSGSRSQSILYGVVMIFSCIFLLLTLVVYVLLWDKQTVHGWTLMSYALSLFFMYVFFVMMHFSQFVLVQGENGNIGGFCTFIGIGLNFFFLSTFCWMTMINFDLWCTFKVLKPTGGRSKGLKRYTGYAIFATVVPLTIVGTGVTLDQLYRDDLESGVIVPEYGRKRCIADPEYAQLVYQYGPVGVLLALNLGFFTFTIYTMYKIQQSTKFATTNASKNRKQKQSVTLFAKLLFVMGIPWIFEVISWYAELMKEGGNSWYWVILDMVNILQAVAIFFIFVFKKDIIHSLEQKYPSFKNFLARILLDPETVEKVVSRFPILRGILSPFTHDNVVGSTARSMCTDTSTVVSGDAAVGKSDIRLQEKP